MSKITRRGLITGVAAATITPTLSGPLLAAPSLQRGVFTRSDVTRIQLRKGARKLALIGNNRVLKSYDLWLGFNPLGHKRFQRDGRTPEGLYHINRRNPRSQFYLSLGISYPNRRDVAYARSRGKSPGGDIFIHGQVNGQKETTRFDWTAGCPAVSNADMKEIWDAVPLGCPVHIYA